MLITCPDCGRSVSDKATACLGCGYPVAAMPRETSPRPAPSPSDPKIVGGLAEFGTLVAVTGAAAYHFGGASRSGEFVDVRSIRAERAQRGIWGDIDYEMIRQEMMRADWVSVGTGQPPLYVTTATRATTEGSRHVPNGDQTASPEKTASPAEEHHDRITPAVQALLTLGGIAVFASMCGMCMNVKPGSCNDIKHPQIRAKCWADIARIDRECRTGERVFGCD